MRKTGTLYLVGERPDHYICFDERIEGVYNIPFPYKRITRCYYLLLGSDMILTPTIIMIDKIIGSCARLHVCRMKTKFGCPFLHLIRCLYRLILPLMWSIFPIKHKKVIQSGIFLTILYSAIVLYVINWLWLYLSCLQLHKFE